MVTRIARHTVYTVKKETGVVGRLLDINWRPCSRTRFDLKPFLVYSPKNK